MALLDEHDDLQDLVAQAESRDDHATWLLRKWCKGKLSAEEVVDGAKTSMARDPHHDENDLLCRLSKINPHNAHRDLERMLLGRTNSKLPPIYEANIPLWDASRQQSENSKLPFNLIHEWADRMSIDNLDKWVEHTPEVGRELDEWRGRVGCTQEGPPIAAFSIWGDTAPFHTGIDSVLLLLWSCLCPALIKRWWITMLPKSLICQCGCAGRHTLDKIWKVVEWSLRALQVGEFPKKDHENNDFQCEWRRERAGKPLRLRGGCVQFRGDWPWLSYVFSLAYHTNRDACFLCRGLLDMTMPLTDASTDARWRRRLVTQHEWLNERTREGNYISPVFSWPGFVFTCIILDWMHMVDLGIAQECLGNILFEVFRELGGLITNPDPTLAALLLLLQDAANSLEVPCPFSKLTFGMLRQDGKPRLKAKAAKTRHLVPIVLTMLHDHFPPKNDRELRRLRCLEYLNAAYQELNNWKEDSPGRLEFACRRHVLLYLSLSREALASNCHDWVQWRWKPKHHMVLHLSGEQARRMGNPSLWWCYSDEGAIGQAVDLAESVHPRTLPKAALTKNRVWELLELSTAS